MELETFNETYAALSASEKAQFTDTIRLLLEEGMIWRENENRRSTYLFIKRFTDLIRGYLDIGGWELVYHEQSSTFQVVQWEGSHRKRFSLDTTIWLLLLRMLYAEQEESTTPRLTRYPTVTIDTLVHRYTELPNARKYKRTSLEEALRQIQSASLVRAGDKGKLKLRNGAQVIELLPPLEAVITAAKAADVAAKLAEYLGPSEQDNDDFVEEL